MSQLYNGAEYLKIREGQSEAHIALHGGQVLSFTVNGGHDVLYRVPLGPAAQIGVLGKAFRGGAPVCMPQFSNFGSFPASHGFCRLLKWAPCGEQQPQLQNSATVMLTSASVREQLAALAAQGAKPVMTISNDQDFVFFMNIALQGENTLNMTLTVENRSNESVYPFTAALHTYFSVQQLDGVSIDGDFRAAPTYIDTADGRKEKANDGLSAIKGGVECDRIYHLGLDSSTVTLSGPGMVAPLKIRNISMPSTVIWNPGSVVAKKLADLPEGGYTNFVCVEGCIIKPEKVLAPGEKFACGQQISVGAPALHSNM